MRSSQGTVELTRSGRYRVRFSFGDGAMKTVDTFNSEPGAEAYRAEMARMIVRCGKPVLKVAAYGKKVFDARELDGDSSDTDNERSRWRNHVESDEIGELPVGEVTGLAVRDWLKRLKRKGLARSTRVHCLFLMRTVMHEAFDRDLHKGPNPCMGLQLKKEKRTDEPWTFLLPPEQDALIAAAPAPLDALIEL